MIKKTSKWVYYTCKMCKKKKYLAIGKYNDEKELVCSSCKKNNEIKNEKKIKIDDKLYSR